MLKLCLNVLFHPLGIKLLFLIESQKKEEEKLMYPSSSARWSLPNPEYYTLRYADGPQLYITEQVSVRGSNLLMSWARVQIALD